MRWLAVGSARKEGNSRKSTKCVFMKTEVECKRKATSCTGYKEREKEERTNSMKEHSQRTVDWKAVKEERYLDYGTRNVEMSSPLCCHKSWFPPPCQSTNTAIFSFSRSFFSLRER
jgi:hypothetical protein